MDKKLKNENTKLIVSNKTYRHLRYVISLYFFLYLLGVNRTHACMKPAIIYVLSISNKHVT